MIKVQLSEKGSVYIDRKGILKRQFCPHQEEDSCGDWCPHFQEPRATVYYVDEDNSNGWYQGVAIGICNGTLLECKAEEFEDLRGKKL